MNLGEEACLILIIRNPNISVDLKKEGFLGGKLLNYRQVKVVPIQSLTFIWLSYSF